LRRLHEARSGTLHPSPCTFHPVILPAPKRSSSDRQE
jgi:hypothetical protein